MNQSKTVRVIALLALVLLATAGGIIWLGLQLQAIVQNPVSDTLFDAANSAAVEQISSTATRTPVTVATATPSVLIVARQSLGSGPAPTAILTTTSSVAEQLISIDTVGTTDVAQRAVVDAPLVNVRSAPSVAGELLIQLPQDQTVEILAISGDEQWYQVCCPLGTAATRETWISAELLRVEPLPTAVLAAATVPAPSTTEDLQRARINVKLANVRHGPGTVYATLGQIPLATSVQLVGRTAAGDWVQICCVGTEEQRGWISIDLLKFVGEKQQILQTLSVPPLPAAPAES